MRSLFVSADGVWPSGAPSDSRCRPGPWRPPPATNRDDEQKDHDDRDDPKHLHPAWRAGSQFLVWRRTAVVAGVGVRGWVIHLDVLRLACLSGFDGGIIGPASPSFGRSRPAGSTGCI